MSRGNNEPRLFNTLPPETVSEDLAPVIEALGLGEHCRQLAMEGWTVIENAAGPEVNAALRQSILDVTRRRGGNMLLTACWATDGYTQGGGGTLIIPGSNVLRRHPNREETAAQRGAVPVECPPGSVVLWDGNLWHSNYPRAVDGERVVCHITYTRMMCRPVEDYADHADRLIAEHGARMSQLLGREDSLFKRGGFDYSRIVQTFNNAKL